MVVTTRYTELEIIILENVNQILDKQEKSHQTLKPTIHYLKCKPNSRQTRQKSLDIKTHNTLF